MKTLLITQARTGSTRLPNKVLKVIEGKTVLEIHIERLQKCKNVSQILVATTVDEADDIIYKMCSSMGVNAFKGSIDDVLDRFYQAAKSIRPEWVVRVTSDCPLIDPLIVDAVIALAIVNDADYCSNTLIEHFPDGQDVEVFKFSALQKAWQQAELKSEREHVTPYIRKNTNFNGGKLFTAVNFPCWTNFSDIRMTIDEPDDFELIKRLINDLGVNETWITYTNHIISNTLYTINKNIIRNEGFLKSLKND
ncbi:cytidylyltransferase domain-containing protein [Mucilaginibacter sp. McL0603]|uniref:cytidylyltransferase domain-containing protein n=1 Tax=Mucilaginibacter sp. McL0603 TaxID=3415670 RepID=UPI003CF6EF68